MRRETYICPDCHGDPVTTWQAKCEVCEGDGRITVELRRWLRRRRLIRALVRLLVILIAIFAMLCIIVYFTDRL